MKDMLGIHVLSDRDIIQFSKFIKQYILNPKANTWFLVSNKGLYWFISCNKRTTQLQDNKDSVNFVLGRQGG